MKSIRCLVVDDSGLMRLITTNILVESKKIAVIGTARDGKEAVEKVKELRPDIILMDLEMGEFGGQYAIEKIMKSYPTPIIVLSSLGNTDNQAITNALDAGALDFINKPKGVLSPNIREIQQQIVQKIKNIAAIGNRLLAENQYKKSKKAIAEFPKNSQYEIVVIGASSGGTESIEKFLEELPENFPLPVVIAQHMPVFFLQSFASRLHYEMPMRVRIAQENEILTAKTAYLADGYKNIFLTNKNQKIIIGYSDEKFKKHNNPSIDCLMNSVAEIYKEKAIGIILSGMGKDGQEGITSIYRNGGLTIAQDQNSSLINSMPKAAINSGSIQKVLSDIQIADFIMNQLQ